MFFKVCVLFRPIYSGESFPDQGDAMYTLAVYVEYYTFQCIFLYNYAA